MYWDPVCGAEVDPETAEWWAEYRGVTYYFCSLSCQEEFLRNPSAFLEAKVNTTNAGVAESPAAAGSLPGARDFAETA